MRLTPAAALLVVLATPSADAAWDKLYVAIGSDNKWASIAAGAGGTPIVVVGQASDGQGNTTPAAKYSANGTDFSNAATGTGGMSMMLGAAAAGSTLLVTRTTFTLGLPPTVSSTLLRSTGSSSFVPGPSVADATFTDVAGAASGFVLVIGSQGDLPAAWLSTDSGQTLTPVGLPAAGANVNPARIALLGGGCAVVVGGDPGETDEQGSVVREAGLGALWARQGSGDFVLVQRDLAPSLYAVDFPTPDIGYVGGSSGGVASLGRTANAGSSVTWLSLPSHPTHGAPTSVTGIHCFAAARCIAMVGFGSDGQVGPSAPLYTTDSGQSWQYDDTMSAALGNLFERASGLLAMHFVSAELGLFAGENHLILRYSAPGASPEERVPCGAASDGGVSADGAAQGDAALPDGGTRDLSPVDGPAHAEDALVFEELPAQGCSCRGAASDGVAPRSTLVLLGLALAALGRRAARR